MKYCENCGGRGIDSNTTPVMNVKCPKCNGTGQFYATGGVIPKTEKKINITGDFPIYQHTGKPLDYLPNITFQPSYPVNFVS